MQTRGDSIEEWLNETEKNITVSPYSIITRSIEAKISGFSHSIDHQRLFCLIVPPKSPIEGVVYWNPRLNGRFEFGWTKNSGNRRKHNRVMKNGLVIYVKPSPEANYVISIKLFPNGIMQATGKIKSDDDMNRIFSIITVKLEEVHNEFGVTIDSRANLEKVKLSWHFNKNIITNITFKIDKKINLKSLDKLLEKPELSEYRTMRRLGQQLCRLKYGKCRINIYTTGKVLINSIVESNLAEEVYEFISGLLVNNIRFIVKIPEEFLDLTTLINVSDDDEFPEPEIIKGIGGLDSW